MKGNLVDIISNLNLAMVEGNKILEIRRFGYRQGKIVHMLMERENPILYLL